ncbi:class I SAM-dependent methyltransferase [Desulfospira joergensenii]|uniref:class I SAM-dependent methyltransferase n=1 Tax=Desulfospira joergensenii TaxID=53329 RepID=UPI0003B60B20|nr:methyltransferase domain-containing protein [Desulfospira joergensenii]
MDSYNREKLINKANRRDFKVLEIGAGHNPDSRTELIIDKSTDNTERGGDLYEGIPSIIANAEDLSFFNDKIFDFVIARHVLEHADDPNKMLQEMQRVSKAGYIECPSELNERLNSRKDYHKWLVNLIDGMLILKPKRLEDYAGLGNLVDYLFNYNSDFRRFYMGAERLWFVKYHWKDSIDYKLIEPSDDFTLNFFDPEILKEITRINFKNRLKGFISPQYYGSLKRVMLFLKRK